MAKSFVQELGERLASVESRLSSLSSGNRLDHASLDGTTLYLKGDGQLGRIGRQPDGSNGVHVVKVQPPPQLTAPILTVGEQAGTCLVEWDGRTFDGRRMPLIHGHTEIWAELVGEDWSPTVAPGGSAKRVGTIRDRTGGEVVVALPQAGTWAVWLRAMGADRETAGPWSPVATVEIKPLVDTEAIEAELEDARDRIEQAEQELAAGMADRVAEIEHLREVRIPALQDALATGLDDVYREAQQYAESQADDAVNQAAANAQSEYDRLQEIAEKALSRAGDNVLEDPSFETDYWLNNLFLGTFEVNPSTLARTGDRGMAITRATTATAATNMTFDTVDVEPDDSWRFSIWYRTDGDVDLGQGAGTRLRIRDGANNILEASTTFEVGAEYSRAVVTYTVPEGVSSLRPTLVVSHTTGALIVDDVSFQEVGAAAEALRLAEVARQQAEAAHIAAGNAVDTAANAYDAASAKNSIHWSLSAPSGTADSTDDVWWQYELRNGRRVVTGQWFWDNGVWRETEIAEEWLPLVNIGTGTYGDLHGDRLEANTVRANHLLVGPRNIITDPEFESLGVGDFNDGWGNFNGGWSRVATSWGTPYTGFAQIADASDTSDSNLHYGGGGPSFASLPCVPGEVYKLRFQVLRYVGGSSDDDYRARFRWADADGNGIAWTESSFASVGNQGWHEVEATAPEGAAWFYIQFYKSGSVGARRGVGNVSLEKMTDSSLIVRGAVKSHSVDTEEFFAAQAVIEKIWTDIVRSRLIQSEGIITEDMIATGAITTPKLTVTEEMVGEVAKLLRIEAGSLASNDIEAMRIVSSLIEATTYLIHDSNGDVSVRLDGVANYIAGRLQAGMAEGSSISLDYGEKVRFSGLNEEGEPDPQRVISTPYLNFHTTNVTYQENQEPSIHLDRGDPSGRDGMMIINPGYTVGTGAFRGKLNVVGDVQSNRVEARERATAGQGFEVPHDDDNLVTRLYRESWSDNTYLLGRHHGASQSRARDSFWISSQYELASGGLRRRFFTWGTPPPVGQRQPMLTVQLTEAASDRNAYVVANSSHITSTGYAINEHNPSSARATYYVHQLAVWGG